MQPQQHRPIVAIVGRPNVGKSSLFNRMVGTRRALVEDLPGTTRDRLYGAVHWRDREFTLVDTGGWEPQTREGYAELVRQQVEQALTEADVILLVVDVRDGVTAADLEIADLLRPSLRPILLLANKADNEARDDAAVQFYELGLGDPIPVSAYHGRGIAAVMDILLELLPTAPVEEEGVAQALPIAIVGRPNVGKSSLLNAILGQERVIVSEVPGTTRDAVDTPFTYKGQPLLLIDTAGIRRRGRIGGGVERHSVMRAHGAIDRAEVALVVIDASEPLTAQDTHIIGYVLEAYKGLVIVVNKWDLVEGQQDKERFTRGLRRRLNFAPWALVCIVSAKEGVGVDKMLGLALAAGEARQRRVPTAQLNVALRQALSRHNPPSTKGHRLNILYVAQTGVAPPTFIFFVNDPTLVHFSYRRYLENSLRQAFDFRGTAIRMVFRGRGGD